MWQTLKTNYLKFHGSFHDSEIIIWSRIQMAVGAIGAGVLLLDPASFDLDAKWTAIWVAANGALSEYLRRRREDFSGDDGSTK